VSDPRLTLQQALAGRYRIEREIGQGGMATVYLAEDPKHGRRVAIKVLKPELAAAIGAERFLREIRTIANLQHPHILGLIDSGEVQGTAWYVMPYVEGESLRDRLEREKQLPIADAVRITTEVAGALDYAHRRGIIHRDIKPENILLQDGNALVADFGIALALTTAGGSRITDSGLSLGTPQYMSPEQAMAERALTPRSDIFSLGCVTYEMLVGHPPFRGVSVQAIVARIMTESPASIRLVRDRLPPAIEQAVFTALAKAPADRFATAAEFAAVLQVSAGAGHGAALTEPMPARLAPSRPTLGRPTLSALYAALVVAAGLALWGWFRPGGRTVAPVTARLTITVPPDQLLELVNKSVDISPDGSQIVYVGLTSGHNLLYLRPLGAFEAKPLAGTEDASSPFFSPDGRWIGFAADGKLKKVLRTGGVPITLATIGGGFAGGAWRNDGTIFFTVGRSVLYHLADGGGTPETLPLVDTTTPVSGRVRSPSLLPDGAHLLVSIEQEIYLVTLATGAVRRLMSGRSAQYLPTGHILFDETEGRMRLVPFDLGRLRLSGNAVPAFEAFRSSGGGPAQVAVSATGTLVYVAGGFNRTLARIDHNGRETTLPFPPRGYRFPRVSPDGSQLVITVDPRPSQVWLLDLARGTSIPVTAGGHSIAAVWSPTGDRIVFYHDGGVRWMQWSADHVLHDAVRWFPRNGFLGVTSWTRSHGLVAQLQDTGGMSVVTFNLGDSIPARLSPPGVQQWQPAVSHNEAYLAYVSNVSGSAELYVRSTEGGPETQVTTHGASDPRWAADDQALYFRNGSRIMTLPVQTRPAFRITGQPHDVTAEGTYDFSQDDNWDVGPDGALVVVRGDPASVGKLMVVTNWFEEIRSNGGGGR
jgi:serine/threonine-protein kinase